MGTGNGTVAACGAIAGMQWGGCGHWADGAGGQGGFDLFGPIWGYYEYTRAVLEYICGCGSWWAPAMGRLLHMGLSQTCSGVVEVPWVTAQLKQALQGSSRFSMGLPGSSKCMKNIFFWIFGVISRLVGQVGTKIGQL